ncbi:unnamed protein product [Ectocarpus sp. CCAP 1310/34]|nr:unnamed protein product [Ectocarpus sp. CCAP 1310/34]
MIYTFGSTAAMYNCTTTVVTSHRVELASEITQEKSAAVGAPSQFSMFSSSEKS